MVGQAPWRTHLPQRMFESEFQIRSALKSIIVEAQAAAEAAGVRYKGDPSAVTFSVEGFAQRQSNAKSLVAAAGFDGLAFEQAVHPDFDSLNRSAPKSAACVYEQFRARLAAITSIAAELDGSPNLHSVTIADLNHRVPAGQLLGSSPRRPAALLGTIYRNLKRRHVPSKGIAVVEVSVVDSNGSKFFEPHLHTIIAGPTLDDLKIAIPKAPRLKSMIHEVFHLRGHLLYMTKFKPEFRSSYEAENGRASRRRNRMAPSDRAEWLSWYAQHGIRELVITCGLRPKLIGEFLTADMGDLLDQLGVRRPQRPPGSVLRPS
ncbi:hypothetical protein NKJ93_30775 [Mesorhizobium sp. M0028]|uniref:hypothetical protein n=1 Tax=unclassified Mesorhizobium TaxID=325217 RepID=UPI00333B273A